MTGDRMSNRSRIVALLAAAPASAATVSGWREGRKIDFDPVDG